MLTKRPSRQLLPVVLLASGAVAGAGAGLVLSDDFDDGVIGDLWEVIETDSSVITVVEQNQRLEFPVVGSDDVEAGAALVADDWVLDSTQDFQLRVLAHSDLPPNDGDVALELIFAYEVDFVAEELIYGVALLLGREADGPYLGYEVSFGGAVVDDDFFSPPGTEVTFYVWYDASADVLGFSATEYFDPAGVLVEDLREQSGTSTPFVIVSAFAEGDVPSSSGSDLFFDTFAIDEGEVIFLCAPDFDGSGTVDVGDLIALLTAWGDCRGCPQDVTGDGVVNVADLIELLAAWGACTG